MLTYAFILTLVFSEMGGGGTTQFQVKATSERLCKALRTMVMTQITSNIGHAGRCLPLLVPEPILPEVD